MVASERGTIDYKSEVVRKLIHLVSLSIPIVYYHITKELALTILVPLTVLSLLIDYGRYYHKALAEVVYKFFGFMMRKHERDSKKKNLNGATYVLLSATTVIILFPKIFVVTSFTVLIVGDIAAALIGRKFGKTKFLFKSLQGTGAFFVFSCIAVMFTPKLLYSYTEYAIVIFSVAIGALAENISGEWADDNFMIPITMSITMWILYTIFFPGLSLILPNVPI
jgi:dolichol kinase